MKLLALALGAALLLSATVACSGTESDSTELAADDSTANGINCEVRLDRLAITRLEGIAVEEPTRIRISSREKIRHLNELNTMPDAFLNVLRVKNIPIKLTGGTVPNFEEFANLRGQTPRNWPAGSTWDNVPGTGNAQGIYLGDSARNNNTNSLAIHEGIHAVDLATGFTKNNRAIKRLYQAELRRRNTSTDGLTVYRRGNIEEYLAVAVDEYYCNANTRLRLRGLYPELHTYVATSFNADLTEALAP
jgi:hypothetical protein